MNFAKQPRKRNSTPMVTTPHVDHSRKHAAFLNIGCGGIGRLATEERRRREAALGIDIPEETLLLDTAPIKNSPETSVEFLLNRKIVKFLSGNRRRFGKRAEAILRALEKNNLLDPDQIKNGARTIRAITQLSMLYHRTTFLRAIKRALKQIMRKYAPQTIVPVMYSSSGGGTGSAIQIIGPAMLFEIVSRQSILLGLDKSILERPISMVVEPFSYADSAAVDHGDAILANSYAYRIESEQLLQRSVIQTVFHIGYSNDEAIVLDDARVAARVLGESIVELQRSYTDFKDRWVDNRGFAGGRKSMVENSMSSMYPVSINKRGQNNEK